MAFPVGRTIKEARAMNIEEARAEGWEGHHHLAGCVVLVLDDGSKIYPSQDSEGNGPGVVFCVDSKGHTTALYA